MENQEDNKVLGLSINQYTKICYILVLIASGFGLLSNLTALVGVYVPGGVITSLLGLTGLGLSLAGLFIYKDVFKPLDLSHFKYIGTIFIIFFLVYMIILFTFKGLGLLGLMIIVLLSFAQFACLFAGFRLYKARLIATKDAVIAMIKSGFKG